jgi:hypothetical protein
MSAPRMSPQPEPVSKSIVRLVVTNWIIGAALGVLFAALLLWLDVAGLRHLMFRDAATAAAGLALLFGGFAVTFGSVVCGSAIMAVAARKRSRDDQGGAMMPAKPLLSPVVVRRPGRGA